MIRAAFVLHRPGHRERDKTSRGRRVYAGVPSPSHPATARRTACSPGRCCAALTWSGDLRTVVPEVSVETQTNRTRPSTIATPGHLAQGIFALSITSLWRGRAWIASGVGAEPELPRAGSRLAGVQILAIQGGEPRGRRKRRACAAAQPRATPPVGLYASLKIANVRFAAGRYSECVTWARK